MKKENKYILIFAIFVIIIFGFSFTQNTQETEIIEDDVVDNVKDDNVKDNGFSDYWKIYVDVGENNTNE